ELVKSWSFSQNLNSSHLANLEMSKRDLGAPASAHFWQKVDGAAWRTSVHGGARKRGGKARPATSGSNVNHPGHRLEKNEEREVRFLDRRFGREAANRRSGFDKSVYGASSQTTRNPPFVLHILGS